jgi:site-specific recombinase XerD
MMRYDLKTAEVAFCDARGLYADFHALRHTYITNIGRSGATMKTHQELARHCEPSLTMRYTHARIDDKVKALDALPAAKPDEQEAGQTAVA